MHFKFQLSERICGYAKSDAHRGEAADIVYRELLGPKDPTLPLRLDSLHASIFSKASGFPDPWQIQCLVLLIHPDLSCDAYINLPVKTKVIANRPVEKGEMIYSCDIQDVTSVDFGIEIPSDSAVISIRCLNWNRSLFMDFGPLLLEPVKRSFDVQSAFAQQWLLLLDLPTYCGRAATPISRLAHMTDGLSRLSKLLAERCVSEARYQELLLEHEWMFCGTYSCLERHAHLNDRHIPDFTGRRVFDNCLDIIELKQPFLALFRNDEKFSAEFNDSWNQAENYLTFCNRQRHYLLDDKKMCFENPRCILLIGYQLSENQTRRVIEKQSHASWITIVTYDQLLAQARRLVQLFTSASAPLGKGAVRDSS